MQWMKDNLPALTKLSRDCQGTLPSGGTLRSHDTSAFSVTSFDQSECSLEILHEWNDFWMGPGLNNNTLSGTNTQHTTFRVGFADVAEVEPDDNADITYSCDSRGVALYVRAATGKTFHLDGFSEKSQYMGGPQHNDFSDDVETVTLYFLDQKSRDRFQRAATDLTKQCGAQLRKNLY
jgi:hypothetical protein